MPLIRPLCPHKSLILFKWSSSVTYASNFVNFAIDPVLNDDGTKKKY